MQTVNWFFSVISWRDVVDITLNSYILFRFYVLFRRSNLFRVAIGVSLLWFFQRMASFAGLVITSWALQGITAVAALIIIVVFRNEIRSILQTKDLKSIFWGFSYKVVETPIQIIAESVFDMAQKHTGALLVFPGRQDLRNIIQGGVTWQGLITHEMLESIFWPDNPVHDGAIIISGDRVAEVGAILPLSHRTDLPSYYGTRHRAAAGLAEVSDALVVVVSEERGSVRVAKDGQIRVMTRRSELEQVLQEHVGVTAKTEDNRKRERLEVVLAACLSLLFITGVWFSISRGVDTLVSLEVPLEYLNRDPAMEVVATNVNTVNVHLMVSDALVKAIRPDQVRARLDLSQAQVGENEFTLTRDNIALPPGVQLRSISPDVAAVTLDQIVRRELPIQVDWIGRLPEGLVMTDVTVDPDYLAFAAPSRQMEGLSTVYTEKVALDNLRKSGSLTANLAPLPGALKPLTGTRERVTVRYVIQARSVLK